MLLLLHCCMQSIRETRQCTAQLHYSLQGITTNSHASHGQTHLSCSLRQIGAINISSLSCPEAGRGSLSFGCLPLLRRSELLFESSSFARIEQKRQISSHCRRPLSLSVTLSYGLLCTALLIHCSLSPTAINFKL